MRHPDMPKAISEDFWKTLSAGKTWVGIMKNRTKSGNFYWVETNSAPILENGKVVGFSGGSGSETAYCHPRCL